jgi:sarcosine oxidase subunit gamma
MSDTALTTLLAQSPLPMLPAIFDAVMITPGTPMARHSVRTKNPQNLPTRINSVGDFANGHALCLGPDEWLLLLPDGSGAPDFAVVPSVTSVFSVTDVSHRALAIGISGANAATLLQRGCPLDLSLPHFPVGKASRTIYDSVEIILWRTGETAFHLEVWRSFAPYIWTALTLAASHQGQRIRI